MKVVIDIEANGLENPTQIWVVICKDIDTDELHIFRNLTTDVEEAKRFITFSLGVTLWIGHNFLGYDYIHLNRLLGLVIPEVSERSIDTLIISKLVDYPRDKHSIEDYGTEFSIPKGDFHEWSRYSLDMEIYCIRDVDICHRIYTKYYRYIHDAKHRPSILLEHQFQLVANALHDNGFCFNSARATRLKLKVDAELDVLDKQIEIAFPARLKLIREVTPKETKHGTLNRSDFRFVKDGDLSIYNGGPFSLCRWVEFNPSSHKQIIEVLNEAGWKPTDKTQTAIENEREINRLKYSKERTEELDLKLKELYTKEQSLLRTGWKINEQNLLSLPPTAPSPAKTLAKRILLESRRRTLTEWLGLVGADSRIHGKFYSIGAWTHRMAHQHPNTANIPTDAKLYGGEMRSLWCAPKNRLLVGVDAEGIQLRIFAHYIDDPEFTEALVIGKKEDKSDPHSLNQRILGKVCKNRQAAKRFIYALLLGAGNGKLAQILECTDAEAREALDRIISRYQGFDFLKRNVIPADAKRGWFRGLDNRKVRIPGDTVGYRKHLCMSGYLQNGEAVVMKKACLLWHDKLKDSDAKLINFVHDEWQTECPNDMEVALKIAQMQADSLREVGEQLGLKCPLAGSFYNEDNKDYTIGTNWKVTH